VGGGEYLRILGRWAAEDKRRVCVCVDADKTSIAPGQSIDGSQKWG
jgi:hypothetical protein